MIQANRTLVIHVKQGYEDRAIHMEKMLSKLNIPFEYILDGDISDLTEERLNEYFKDGLASQNPMSSCAIKHFIAYEKIIEEKWDGALILEDDICLKKKFTSIFNACLTELNSRTDLNKKEALISLENTRLRFIPRSKYKKGQYIYKGDKCRMTGAYYITHDTAKSILEYIKLNKCNIPIDILHEFLLEKDLLPYYWCEPTIAEQGSHSGLFDSGISSKTSSLIQKAKWSFKKFYKRTLYYFR